MQVLSIGREAGNQIILNDNLVSRQHAQLAILNNGQVMLKDLGSSNGTFVNGKKITETYLEAGDIVKCGASFLNWSQYLGANQHMVYQPPSFAAGNESYREEEVSIEVFSLGDVFKYLTKSIFEIGNLYKTNWNRSVSIIFLKAIPVFVTLLITIIIYSQNTYARFSFYPTVAALLFYVVCPFLSIYLLSLVKNVSIDKVALASGITGFLNFLGVLTYALCTLIYYDYFKSIDLLRDGAGEYIFPILVGLVAIGFFVNLVIATAIHIYKYFISIGVNRSVSVYLIVTAWVVNAIFNLLSFYVIYLIVKDTYLN